MGLGVLNKVGDVVGSFLNSATGVNDQMNAQNKYNQQMWQLQNQYNSPAAQLARMREAGIDINPTSYALGTGNLSNTATFVGSASGSPAGNPISMAMGVAEGIQGIRNQQANIKNTEANTENVKLRNELMPAQIAHTELENAIMRHNLNISEVHNTPVGSNSYMSQLEGIGEQIGEGLFNYHRSIGDLADKVSKGIKNYYKGIFDYFKK